MNNTKKFSFMLFLGCVCILNAQETKSPKIEVFDLGQGLKIEMVLIPAGKFQMGALESEKSYSPNEKLHEVTLTKSFYLGKVRSNTGTMGVGDEKQSQHRKRTQIACN